jgi:DNA-binding transcriptional regulator YhcF (GntR family)
MTPENDKEKKIDARYQAIAYQVAKKIAQGEILEHAKLSGRTLLASEYQVSSETIRKAMAILQRYGVVTIHDRSGIVVASKTAAEDYVAQYVAQKEDRKLLSETVAIQHELSQLEARVQSVLNRLIGATKLGFFPFDFFAFTLEEGDHHLHQDLKTTQIKNKTGALVIGYEDQGLFVQNPDADAVLKPGMTLYLLGGTLVQAQVEAFFKGGSNDL